MIYHFYYTGPIRAIIDENSGGYAWEWLEGHVFFPNHSEEEINTILNEFMGIEEYILMETLPYDGIHHIDMHMKLLDEETLLVAEYPEGVADGPQIEANLQYVLENYTSSFGTPFKVIRIPSITTTIFVNYKLRGKAKTHAIAHKSAARTH